MSLIEMQRVSGLLDKGGAGSGRADGNYTLRHLLAEAAGRRLDIIINIVNHINCDYIIITNIMIIIITISIIVIMAGGRHSGSARVQSSRRSYARGRGPTKPARLSR